MEQKLDKKLLNMLNAKKAFIFDFDGTMTSSNNIIYKAMQVVCKSYGYTFTDKDFEDVKDKPSNEYFEKMQSVISQPLDYQKVVDQYNQACDEILKTEKLECFDYVKTILKTFPNKIFVLASNNVKSYLKARLKDMGILNQFFAIVACGDEIKKQMVYENTLKICGVKQEDCVVFEDAQKYIQQAKDKGITTVGIVHDYNKDLLDADFFVEIN